MAYFQDENYRNVSVRAEKTDIERLKALGKEHNETLQSTYTRAFKDFTGQHELTNDELDEIQLALYFHVKELQSYPDNEAQIEKIKALKNKITKLSSHNYPKY